ncbi:phosphatidylserine decarboxylase [Mucilaginibacter gracilis]|uniref:Phosphatidylserine decarboxylase n=1 Tax=Mucilaginibacter gracilis TaxID=423350 RepID=A0A495IWR8_9SPHI|nr:phosphatidylserine decarboxylase [Mucilaginibacter gracilis]RKR80953.1 phosphatidylserine decarboxylase [Mucilaginibacter gracilis]
MPVYVYDRQSKKTIEEHAIKLGGLMFLYKTLTGKLLTNLVLKRRFISKSYGRVMDGKRSLKQIPKFIEHYKLDVNEIKRPLSSFKSFNDFFIRELKPEARPIDMVAEHLISAADSRLMIWDLSKAEQLPVKGYWYKLNDLVKDKALEQEYAGGWCYMYRLAPQDFHRYGYIDNGKQEQVRKIKGILHSVNRIALAETKSVMAKNYRELTVLHTENFGKVIHIEVGALFVGKIVQRYNSAYTFKRGEEKGWFEFGGSTVIQLFKKDAIVPDADIIEQSIKGIETLVKIGEKVGLKA